MNTIKSLVQRRCLNLLFSRSATTKKKIHDPQEEEKLPSKLIHNYFILLNCCYRIIKYDYLPFV